MTELQAEAAKMALNKMIARGHFDICTVDEILRTTGGVPNGEDYRTLRLLHCVDFKDFTPRLRLEFPGLLQRVLESPSMALEIKFKPLARAPLLVTLNQ